jgi:hypothetical protein
MTKSTIYDQTICKFSITVCTQLTQIKSYASDTSLQGRMTAKEGPSSFTLVSANISWRFVRLNLKSCFEVYLAMYEVGCYW